MRLQLEDLGRQFGDTWALRHVDLELEPGILGLLGPNGAGKSTLMRLVTTALEPTEGSVRWNGKDVTEHPWPLRNDLGYLPQEFGVYPDLTVAEFLSYLAATRSTPADRVDDVLEIANLSDARDERLATVSGGVRRRVGVAQALLGDPDLLVVDEPTVGLDPEERARFRSLLAELAEDRVVVLSTHIVPDVEATANEVALLNEGRLVAHDRPGALVDRASGAVWEWVVPDEDLDQVRREHAVTETVRRGDGVQVRTISGTAPGQGAEPVEPTLEDAYVHLVGAAAGR